MSDDTTPKYDPNPTRIGGQKLVLDNSGSAKKRGGADKKRTSKQGHTKADPTTNRRTSETRKKATKTLSPTAKAGQKKPSFKQAIMSRQICYNILVAVDEGGQLDLVLNGDPDLPKLEDRDRRFVRLLATTCLRRRGQLEKVLAPMIPRRPFGAQETANIILLMGAAQLLFLKTGPHAAVDSTVELMRQSGFDRLTGLANAVMRRLTREGEKALERTKSADNLPDWLRQSWVKTYGTETTSALCDLAMQPPSLDITPASDIDQWATKLEGRIINNHTVRRQFDGDPSKLSGFADGAWWVQDAAAALPATLLGDIKGKDVIDLCAAPGGKTAQLIAAGASVTAIESARKRVDKLRRNLKRLQMNADLKLADGRKFVPDFPADAVLLDAPCSATGTLRRRPDILSNRDSQDIQALQSIQWELTTTALGWLKPGGRLVYVTCSLQPEEGEAIIDAILKAADGAVEIDPISASEAGDFAAAITDQGTMRIIPTDFNDIGGVDGFYIARLKSLV